MEQKQCGLTLLELLITVVIIGIITAIAVPKLLRAIFDARMKKTTAHLKTIQTELVKYQIDNKQPPNTDGEIQKFADVFPNIPAAQDGFGYPFFYISDEKGYCVCSFGKDQKIDATDNPRCSNPDSLTEEQKIYICDDTCLVKEITREKFAVESAACYLITNIAPQ